MWTSYVYAQTVAEKVLHKPHPRKSINRYIFLYRYTTLDDSGIPHYCGLAEMESMFSV